MTYISPFAPKMRPTALHVGGVPIKAMGRLGFTAGAFGGVALGTVIYFMSGMPRVQQDILIKIPILGDYWTGREKPASDNPF